MSNQEKINIENNQFTGVHWDEKAVEAVNNTARALLNLTELFKSQNIVIESMLTIKDVEIDKENTNQNE